jgi:hypothetical protein
MGCWGTGPFDSDHAADFAGAVEYCTDTQARTDLLAATLGAYLEKKFTDKDFDARYEFPGEIEEAVASAAYVADRKTGKGQFTNISYAQGHDRATDTWYTIELDEPTPELVALATRAMERLLGQMHAALVDANWRNTIVDILGALA